MARTAQFVKFTSDLLGLDRTLRLIQAVILVVLSYPSLLTLLHQLLSAGPLAASIDPASLSPVLSSLATHLDLARRWMRTFSFLEAFFLAQKLGSLTLGLDSSAKKTAFWFDVAAVSFDGGYLFTELLTFPDALGIEGLSLWDEDWLQTLNLEAMRFWFFALVSTVLAEVVRLRAALRKDQTPAVEQNGAVGEKDIMSQSNGAVRQETTLSQKNGRKQNDPQRREQQATVHQLIRKISAGLLDLVIPAQSVGWLRVSAGIVNLAMVGSTVLTGLDVWERCGREVAAAL